MPGQNIPNISSLCGYGPILCKHYIWKTHRSEIIHYSKDSSSVKVLPADHVLYIQVMLARYYTLHASRQDMYERVLTVYISKDIQVASWNTYFSSPRSSASTYLRISCLSRQSASQFLIFFFALVFHAPSPSTPALRVYQHTIYALQL